MASKPDITTEELLKWDEFKLKLPDEALSSIYLRVEKNSKVTRSWYWASIKVKRWTSLGIRSIAFLLLLSGTVLPIVAGISSFQETRFIYTQVAVIFLAAAGLIQVADKIFGCSSGWMRYITTVTMMEKLTITFELEWAEYLLSKGTAPDQIDTKALFDLAKKFEEDMLKLRSDETGVWVSEFNAGLSLLDSVIKTQREETDKKLEVVRNELSAKKTAAAIDAKSNFSGAIEVTLVHRSTPKEIKISIDDEKLSNFLGLAWSRTKLAAGLHKLTIHTLEEPPQVIEKVFETAAGAVARVEIKFTN